MENSHSAEEHLECIAERLQASVKSYIGGLEVTGGRCNTSNCYWWPIGFKWKAGEYFYLRDNEVSTEIYLPDIFEAINNLDPNEAKEGLGVFTAPDGSMKDQIYELGGKVDICANIILNGYLHMIAVWKAFWGKILE